MPSKYLKSKILLDKSYKGGWKRLVYQRSSITKGKTSPHQDRFVITPCGKRIRSSTKLLEFLKNNPKYCATIDPLEVHFEGDLGTVKTPNKHTKAIIKLVNDQKSKIGDAPKDEKLDGELINEDLDFTTEASDEKSDKVNDEYELISDIKIEEFPLESYWMDWMQTDQSADSLEHESHLQLKIDPITDFHKNGTLIGNMSDDNFFKKIKTEVEPFEENATESEDINKVKQRLISQRLLEIEEILEKRGLNDECSQKQKLSELDDASEEDLQLQNFREIVHELERHFIDSPTRPSTDQMLEWSKAYEIEYELIECYFTRKWNGKLLYEKYPKNSSKRTPKFHLVDNLTHILYGQEKYEIEIDHAENDVG